MNRREALAIIACAGVAATIPGSALAKCQPDRTTWDRAMAAYERANSVSDAFDSKLERVWKAHEAAVADVPHITSGDIGYGHEVSTAKHDRMHWLRADMASVRYLEPCAYADHKARQQFLDKADKREAVIAEIDARTGYSAAHAESERLCAAIGEAETVLLDMPAPDGEALLWKVNRLYAPGEGIWTEGVEDQTIADLHRFLLNGTA